MKEGKKLKIGQDNYLKFNWSELSKEDADEARKHIMADPCDCNDCGDICNRGDLLNHFGDSFLVCKKCIELYGILYK